MKNQTNKTDETNGAHGTSRTEVKGLRTEAEAASPSGASLRALAGRVWPMDIELGRIVPSPTNPRKEFPEEMIQKRAESFRKQGQLVALIVRPLKNGVDWKTDQPESEVKMAKVLQNPHTKFEIADGECRWRAAAPKYADLKVLKCDVRCLSDEEVVEIQWSSWLQRENLSALDEAMGLAGLWAQGWSVERLCERFGLGKSSVFNGLKLARLEGKARELLASGEMSPSVATIVATIPGKEGQERFWKELQRYGENLSVRTAKGELERSMLRPLVKASWNLQEEGIVKGCGACGGCPKNTRNMGEMDPELVKGPARCTDLGCWAKKEAAMEGRLAKSCAAEGIRFVARKEWDRIRYTPAVSGLKQEGHLAWEAGIGHDSEMTWGELLKKKKVEVKPAMVAATEEGLQKLWRDEDLVAAGVLKKEKSSGGRNGNSYEATHRKEQLLLKGVKGKVLELLTAKLAVDPEDARDQAREKVVRAYFYEVHEPYDSKRKVEAVTVDEALLGLARELCGNRWYRLSAPPEGLSLLGVDVKKVALAVKGELAAAKKKKGKKGKKARTEVKGLRTEVGKVEKDKGSSKSKGKAGKKGAKK